MCTKADNVPRKAESRLMLPGFPVKWSLCSEVVSGVPTALWPITSWNTHWRTPSAQTPRAPRSGSGHHWNVAQPPRTTHSLVGLPTRVPISANNNIHINRVLDHSHPNARDSWQGDPPLCHPLAYLPGTWQDIFAIPSFTVASSCDFKLSFSGVDWWKWFCHQQIS